MPCYSPLKGFRNKETGGIIFRRCNIAGEAMEVACGQCLGCRLDRSRMWASRIVHEASLHDENCFITLTYADEHLPEKGSLRKKDFQNFMKRLRKRLAPRKIRYYMCGEYGDETYRPHYHACIFGFDGDPDELFAVNGDDHLYTSKMLSETWGLGFVTVGSLSFQSAAYCARYILKKVNGHNAPDHYERVDINTGEVYWLLPEYTSMSLKPGIGRDFYERYKTDFFPSDDCPVPGVGILPKVPRYYEEVLRSESECDLQAVKLARKEFRERHKEEYSPSRLMQKYKVKKRQVEMLKRGKI